MKCLLLFITAIVPLELIVMSAWGAEAMPPGGALAGERYRVIVSTDIGGKDPDDFQSLVHYLVYADVFDTEGLISSPPGAGRKQHILEVIDAYAKDSPSLQKHSRHYPAPDELRRIAKQGVIDKAPPAGSTEPSEGSRWIIERAKADDKRPLWLLIWGSITDVAQAVHDDPSIKAKLRIYYVGSWNTEQDRSARDYLYKSHPDLWWIETDTTFRGMYMGGNRHGDLDNRQFVAEHVAGHGTLGDFLAAKKADIKMGDTPSVLYLLRGDPEKPESEHWGGQFVRPDPAGRPTYWTDNRAAEFKDAGREGAKTVNNWREAYLRDWQSRMEWLSPNSGRK